MQSPNHSVIDLTERKLRRLKELKDSIKELEAEFKMLSDEVKTGFFLNSDEFVTSKGLVLATYKEQVRSQFDTTKFKKEHPSLYNDYLDIKLIKVFLLK